MGKRLSLVALVQLATPRHLELLGGLGGGDPQGHAGAHLPEQAICDLARGDTLALLARKGAVVDAESHRERGRVHLEFGETAAALEGLACERVAPLK